MAAPDPVPPTLEQIRAARDRLGASVRRTPTVEIPLAGASAHLKLELFQHAGSFKTRAALLGALDLDAAGKAAGLTTVSAGNHAMAVGYAARAVGTTAKVVMPKSANPARIAGCRALGAEVVLVDDVQHAFPEVERIQAEEGRAFLHPFEGETVALGTATVAVELLEDAPDLDAVIVPIGGGGLCSGIATAVKAIAPRCAVYGVEPEGADTMHRSFAAGEPQALDHVATIADSLGAPHAAPYSFGLCRRFVDELVLISDDEMRMAMAVLFRDAKLAVEPAGAAATAALLGGLRGRLEGKRVGVIVCGANIDLEGFGDGVRRGFELLGEG